MAEGSRVERVDAERVVIAEHVGTIFQGQPPPSRLSPQEQDNRRRMLTRVGTEVKRRLAESLHGAGWTTLDLARVLIERAEHDEALPMPVMFHLASWATKRPPLADWLVDELVSPRY